MLTKNMFIFNILKFCDTMFIVFFHNAAVFGSVSISVSASWLGSRPISMSAAAHVGRPERHPPFL